MKTLNANGQTRKSLAEQIDRLDSILDGLADALNETVVTAVQEAVGRAVREAVQATLSEVQTNAELQQHLSPVEDAVPPSSALRPVLRGARGVCDWLAGVARHTWKRSCSTVRQLCQATTEVVGQCVAVLGTVGRHVCRRTQAMLQGGWLRLVVLYESVLRWPGLVWVALGSGLVYRTLRWLASHPVTTRLRSWADRLMEWLTPVLQPVERFRDGAWADGAT
jgi:hypothetical protein